MYMLKSYLPVPQKVTVFGDNDFKERTLKFRKDTGMSPNLILLKSKEDMGTQTGTGRPGEDPGRDRGYTPRRDAQEKPGAPPPGSQTSHLQDQETIHFCCLSPPSVVLCDDSLSHQVEKPSTLEMIRAVFSVTRAKSDQIKCSFSVSWKMSHKRMTVF